MNSQKILAIKQAMHKKRMALLGKEEKEKEDLISLSLPSHLESQIQHKGRLYENITLNENQSRAVELAAKGHSFCLVGAAGTGKTTTVHAAMQNLLSSNIITPLQENTKYLNSGSPGLCGIAFTRRAANNLRNQMPEELQPNTITLHKLLEFHPVEDWIDDPTSGAKRILRFEPGRTRENPLPRSLQCIVIDEASMISVELFKLLIDAISHPITFIFIGDINQLPPPLGDTIFGYALLKLPRIELTHVYRQALESPILALAHEVLKGKPIEPQTIREQWRKPGLSIGFWPAKKNANTTYLDEFETLELAAKFLHDKFLEKKYDPFEDMVILPWRKSHRFSTKELNLLIAEFLDFEERKLHKTKQVYQIISGFNKVYYAEGDRVLMAGREGSIIKIYPNPQYTGGLPAIGNFTRFGHEISQDLDAALSTYSDDLDLAYEFQPSVSEDSDITNQASHVIMVEFDDDDTESYSTRGDINKLQLGYCITAYNAQGLQAERVFLMIHPCHDISINREFLYTSITRAAKELIILCDQKTFLSGVKKQTITGNTLEQKAKHFQNRRHNEAFIWESFATLEPQIHGQIIPSLPLTF